jgi:hypothetical protein
MIDLILFQELQPAPLFAPPAKTAKTRRRILYRPDQSIMITPEKLTRMPRVAFPNGARRAEFALTGRLVRDVDDPRAEWGWNDYAGVGKEICREQI